MKTQITVYRAKRKDNGEWVEGFLVKDDSAQPLYRIVKNSYYTHDNGYPYYEEALTLPLDTEINPETLAIHFPDMNDKNGERIFAALSESGIGGSIILASFRNDSGFGNVVFDIRQFVAVDNFGYGLPYVMLWQCFDTEVTGIYEGETK